MQLNPGDVINVMMGANINPVMCFVVKDEKEYTEILVPHKDKEYVTQNVCEIKFDLYGVEKTTYLDAARLSYVSHDRIKGRIAQLSDLEREKMLEAIKSALGLKDRLMEHKDKPVYHDEEYLYDLEIAKTEARIYKGLYEKLLGDVVRKEK